MRVFSLQNIGDVYELERERETKRQRDRDRNRQTETSETDRKREKDRETKSKLHVTHKPVPIHIMHAHFVPANVLLYYTDIKMIKNRHHLCKIKEQCNTISTLSQ